MDNFDFIQYIRLVIKNQTNSFHMSYVNFGCNKYNL